MRPLQTEELREQKGIKQRRFLSIFMLSILVLSSLGFAFLYSPGNSNSSAQQGQNSSGGNDGWNVNLGGQKLSFVYDPASVKNVPVDLNTTLSSYSGKKIYLASSSPDVLTEISSTLGLYTERLQKACYGNCSENVPEKNCSDTLIVWRSSEENKVYQHDSCVFIEGDLHAVDAFLFKVLDIH